VYTNQVLIVNSRRLYETNIKAEPIVRVYLPNCLVNSRCLQTTVKAELIDSIYLPSSPSQLALVVRDKSKN
jgi:hypothetical protein